MSESAWESEQDTGEDQTQDFWSQHQSWMDIYNTPPPGPTQETQDTQNQQDGSEIPLRQWRAPHRYGWSTPDTPAERRPRGGH